MRQLGLAKKAFVDAYQRAPWLPLPENRLQKFPWPLLNLYLKERRLAYLDYILIHRLLRRHLDIKQEVALFLTHVTLAAKEGHLCVSIEEEGLNPSVQQLWKNEEGVPLTNEEAGILTQLMRQGSTCIPEGLLTPLDAPSSRSQIPLTPLCRQGKNVYLQRHWMFETLFIHYFHQHAQTSPCLRVDEEKIKRYAHRLVQEKVLFEEQAEAIIQGCKNALTLVTGGPGTGKTYTAGYLIKVFWEHLSEEEKSTCQIILAAPTGKAAANLQRSLSQAVASLEGFPPLQAKTLHALLNIRPFSYQMDPQHLSADFVVVDESSMIDIRLMAALFASLKKGSRIVLLGDSHQLPSVEAGSVFLDLIRSREKNPSLPFSCISLNVCVRAELRSLIDFAQCIHRKQSQEVLHILNGSKLLGVKRLNFSADEKEAQSELIEYVRKDFPTVVKPKQEAEELLELFQGIRLLSPIRQGLFGVEAINQAIWQSICQEVSNGRRIGWLAIPILIVMNDYRQDLFNGETGVLMRRLPLQHLGGEDYALFPSRAGDGKMRRLSVLLLPKYEYGYCLSVHKSQGSEFNRVIFVLPEGTERFGCELFYTAVTRARKTIEIYGADHTILKTVSQQGGRLSGIGERLRDCDRKM